MSYAISSVDCINYARQKNLYAVYFPYDTTRANDEDLTNHLTGIMAESPPNSIGVVDMMGCALPEAIKGLIKREKRNSTASPIKVAQDLGSKE